ncbi:TPA: coiled-coil domain-containing protein [Enterococcus faecium]
MASSLYNLALDFSKELNYTKAIMARQGDKGITVTVKPFLNGLQMDTSGGTFTLKGTTPSNRYVDSVATSVTSEEVTFSLDGTFMSEAGYYKHCYVEYRKDNQILTTQDIIFFSLGVSDISQGQADEYVSQLEELIRKYNETFDAFMAEIKGRVDSLNQQITDLTGQAKTLQDKLDALKEEISKLGNLQVMYSNSLDFGAYDYSGNPNLMRVIKASDFIIESETSLSDVGYNSMRLTSRGVDRLFVTALNNIPSLVSGKTYTISAKVKLEEGITGNIDKIRICYRKTNSGTILLEATTKGVEVGKEITIKGTEIVNYEITDLSSFYLTIDTEIGSKINGSVIVSDIKIEEGSTATPYQPNLLDAPYYLSKVALGKNLITNAQFPITTLHGPNGAIYFFNTSEEIIIGETYTVSLKGTPTLNKEFHIYLGESPNWQATLRPVEGLKDVWSATFKAVNSTGTSKLSSIALYQKPDSVPDGSFQIDWFKIEKGDTRTPNISEYKYRGIGMRDSNNPKDYVWDLAPKYVEENLATESKVTEIIGEANKYTDNSIEAVNINVTNIADDLAKQINVNENAARNYTDTKKIEAVNESKKYTDEVFRKEIVNLTVKNGNLGTARLYRQGNCVTIYFFDLNGRNSGGNDSVILTVPEGYRTPISFEQLVGSTDRSAFNNAQLGFGADGNIYWRRNTSYASSYTFTVTYII